jgi:RNA polymerase sigma-70 factor (ECF subfamily)
VGILQQKEDDRLELTPEERILGASAARSASDVEPWPVEIGELFSAYHQRVSIWVRRLGGPGLDVDDAVQEVFLFAHRRLHRWRGREKLVVWLYRVTENVVRHQRRRLHRQRRFLADGGENHLATDVAVPAELAADAETRRQALQLIYRVLDRMSERSRSLIILFELEELSGQEIAELKGAKVATVWVWLHRARAEFRRHLEAFEKPSSLLRELNR